MERRVFGTLVSLLLVFGAFAIRADLTRASPAPALQGDSDPSEKLQSRSSSTTAEPKEKLVVRLTSIRQRVLDLEQGLIDGLRSQKEARSNIRKIKALMKLQREERDLGQRRMQELERTISELEARRGVLRERISGHQRLMHQSLIDMERSLREQPRSAHLAEQERIEAPRRKVLGNLVEKGLKEIEELRVDLADADTLEMKIQEEKQQLAYLFHDLKEQEGVLELNRQLQADLLKKKHHERVAELENYRKLKGAEVQVEKLIGEFNARLELEKAVETERVASRAMMQGHFAKLKGTLSLPVSGKIVSQFGRAFDPKSNLHIFKKGVEIATGKKVPVVAISAGKVAYSGELPNYGRIAIIDHGDHFYSLCGNLGELSKQAGDSVVAGDTIGVTDESGTPVYFEIRARNVAVNPLQWVSN